MKKEDHWIDKIEENFKKFKIVMCPKCGSIQVCSSKVELHCKFCNKSTTFKKKNDFGLNLKIYTSTDHPNIATMLCLKIKEQIINEKIKRLGRV